jgi:hypothetical protein
MMSRIWEHLHSNVGCVRKPVMELPGGLNILGRSGAAQNKRSCRQEETGHSYEQPQFNVCFSQYTPLFFLRRVHV